MTDNQKLTKLTCLQIFTMIFVLLVAGGNSLFAQTKIRQENNSNTTKTFSTIYDKSILKKTDIAERSIAVHPKVYISLCILQGSVKVNGWKRNEVRVFVEGIGNEQISFEVRERGRTDKKPVWVQVLGKNTSDKSETGFNVCLSGDVELDVPENASIKIENHKGESETIIDSVRSVKVEVLGGDIYLNNISEMIDANTYQGGVTVRNSSGKMSLTTTTGNIIAYNTFSSDIGDNFKAKTRSGAITLQTVEQKELEVSSVSGSINYVGNVKPFGQYTFSTTNGSINLAIPKSSSCQLIMAYGGAFQSELALEDLFKERTGSLVFLKGKMGKGEANLNIKSFNGTISIREKKESQTAFFKLIK